MEACGAGAGGGWGARRVVYGPSESDDSVDSIWDECHAVPVSQRRCWHLLSRGVKKASTCHGEEIFATDAEWSGQQILMMIY